MMKRISILLLAAVLAAAACAKQALQTTYEKQAGYIESFLAAQMKNDPSARLTMNGGACRLILHDTLDPTRDSLQRGQKVRLNYGCYLLTSSSLSTGNLVATNIEALAGMAGWGLTDKSVFTPLTLTLDDNLVEGLADGLWGVQDGDEGYILFTAQYGYGNKDNGTIPALSALAYFIQIEKINVNE